MISNINDLPFELLVHTFSFLPSSELINIGRICKKWAELVRDDHIWEEAFLKNWGRAPDMYIQHVYDLLSETYISKTYSRLDGRSWKQEYLARSRLIMPWRAGKRQRVHCNLEQIENVGAGHLWKAKDGKLKLCAVSQTGMLTASFENGGRLNRNVHYFSGMKSASRTIKFNHNSNYLVVGHEEGSVDIYSNSALGGFTLKRTFNCQLDDRMSLEFVSWIDQDKIICQASSLEATILFVWDSKDGRLVFKHRIERFISVLKDLCFISNTFFWLESEKLATSSKEAFVSYENAARLFKLSKNHLLVVKEGGIWEIVSVAEKKYLKIELPKSSAFSLEFCSVQGASARVYYLDQEGWQWIMTINTKDLSYSFFRFQQGYHDSNIEDVFIGKSIIIVLRSTVLAIHDAVSMRLLLWQPIQNRRGAADNNFDQRSMKKLLHVREEDGLLLFQWKSSAVQVWNFGRGFSGLDTSTKAAPKLSRKTEINLEIRSEYQEWIHEKKEEERMERLRIRLNPDDMNEDEMIAMALSLSMVDGGRVSVNDSTEDEDVLRALELSLTDL